MKTEKNRRQGENNDFDKRRNPNLWKLREKCFKNAIALVKESIILFKSECYERAFMLSYTAMEELGKYLIVCDFITGIVSFKEFKDAFHDHRIKVAYVHNNVRIEDCSNEELFDTPIFTLVYDKTKYKSFFKLRNLSAYVDYTEELAPISPDEEIDKELAEKMINRVTRDIDQILFAEDLNGRIGSKAIYK